MPECLTKNKHVTSGAQSGRSLSIRRPSANTPPLVDCFINRGRLFIFSPCVHQSLTQLVCTCPSLVTVHVLLQRTTNTIVHGVHVRTVRWPPIGRNEVRALGGLATKKFDSDERDVPVYCLAETRKHRRRCHGWRQWQF